MNIQNNNYTGMTGTTLKNGSGNYTGTSGLGANIKAVAFNSGAAYCLEDNEGNGAYHYVGGNPGAVSVTGPQSQIWPGTCLAAVGTAAS
jgi:hypothetical protein